ncbi:MAG TPA: hypothetical protein P5137_05470 [Candidatus Brocadiia bacterium]|nr:hypothetical protein [Candidatus Brocadiia bacterium]
MLVRLRWMLACVFAVVSFPTLAQGQAFDPGGMTSLKLAPQAERARKPQDVDVAVWPTGLIDGEKTHYLTQSSPTIMIFALANPKARELRQSRLVFDLPEGVSLLATNAYLPWHLLKSEKGEREGKPYTHYEVPCSVHPTTFPRSQTGPAWYDRRRPPAIWLTTDLAPGAPVGKVYYRVRYWDDDAKDAADSPENSVRVAVLPPIQAQQPKIAKCGVMGRFILNYNRAQTEVPVALTSYIQRMGYNYYFGYLPLSPDQKELEKWGEGPINNGFDVRVGKEVPESIRYVSNSAKLPVTLVAPWAIYRRDPWVVESLFGELQRRMASGDMTTVWANWEPYSYLADGDYSARTMQEFIRWSGLPADDVSKGWSTETVKKHALKWKQFKAWELGEVTRTLADEVAKIGREAKAPARFTVCLSNDAIWTTEITPGSHPFAVPLWGDMPYNLQTWQYYYVPDASGAYPVSDRSCAPQVVRSSELARFLDRLFGPDRKVRAGCVYGWDQTGGHDGFFLPEQLGFLHLSTVFAGSANSQNYAEWPIWDGRYAQQAAIANTRIARWEDMILKGKKVREHVVIPVSPYPQSVPVDVKPSDQELKGDWEQPGYLYSFEYQKDGARLITVANTWDYGDVFFRLRFPSLPPGARYVLSEPEEARLFANGQGETLLTAGDLARGVVVHVGATRWGAFLLTACDLQGKPGGSVVTPAMTEKAMSARRAALADAIERDRLRYRMDLASVPVGIVGKSAHGERVVDDRLAIGYPTAGRFGADLHVEVVEEGGDKALRLVDNDARGMIYLNCGLDAHDGVISFDITLKKARPFAVALHPAGVALTLPSQDAWRRWFTEPYQPRLVCVTPSSDTRNLPSGAAVDTGIEAQAGRTYRVALEWHNIPRLATVTVDGKVVAADVGYVHPNKAVIATSLMFASYTLPFSGGDDNGDFTVSNIKILKAQARQAAK